MNRIRVSGEMLNIRYEGGCFKFNIHDSFSGLVAPCEAPADIVPVTISECCKIKIEGVLTAHQKCHSGETFTDVEIKVDDFQQIETKKSA